MNRHEYLNEEKYQKAEKKISFVALIILVLGLSLGGFLIYKGVHTDSSKLDDARKALEIKRDTLIENGVTKSSNYLNGESYQLYILTNALDPSFSYCSFSEYKNNDLTREYCSLKNSTSDFSKTSFIMFGSFICISTLMISLFVFSVSKQRKMLAFMTQQAMPIAQEGIEKMTPTVAKSVKEITKSVKDGLR